MVCDNITDHIAAEQASLHLAWRASPGRLRASPMRNFGLGYVLSAMLYGAPNRKLWMDVL
jgi:hypothetical protein